MSTRKIKDAELDGEKVYFKGHAKATFMSDGRNVESAIGSKQDAIDDLATIREGASKGATALQEESFKGTVASVTAGDGLKGGTITSEGTISLPAMLSSESTMSFAPMDDYFKLLSLMDTDSVNVNIVTRTVKGNAVGVDKYGRVTRFEKSSTLMSFDFYEYQPATNELHGLMSASDKEKLDGLSNVEVVDHGTGDTAFAITPNVFHKWGEVSSLSLTLATPSDSSVYNEYMFEFVSGSTATTLILPDIVEWVKGVPSVESGKTYQVSIVDNIGLIVGV